MYSKKSRAEEQQQEHKAQPASFPRVDMDNNGEASQLRRALRMTWLQLREDEEGISQ